MGYSISAEAVPGC